MVRRLSTIVEEHDDIRMENAELKTELSYLKREYEQVSKQIHALQRQLDRTNEAKEVVKLCKLMLAGVLVPVASVLLIYSVIDGTLFVSSADL